MSRTAFKERVWEPLQEICRTPVLRLVLLLTLHVLSALSLLAPFTPRLLTNYFAAVISTGEGSIECTGHDQKEDIPSVCPRATNSVLAWKSACAMITNFLLGVVLFPSLGKWSDMCGRKPFIVAGLLAGSLPSISVLLYLHLDFPLWWFFIAGMVFATLSPFLTAFAYIADLISAPNRTIAFASVGIVFSIAFTIGPILTTSGLISTARSGAWASLACGLLSAIGGILILPESLSADKRLAARRSLESDHAKSGGFAARMLKPFAMFWDSLSILFRTTFFAKLTLCILALYVNFEEVYEMETQYFQEVAGFNKMDTALLLAVAGMSSWFTITIGLWILLGLFRMSEKQVLLFGMIMFAMQQILYAFVRSKAIILVITGIGTTANLVLPAISSMKSNNVSPQEQGALQGALMSAQSVAKGFGPLLFYFFFVVFRSKEFYLPGAPFVFGFVLLLVAIGVALSIEVPKSGWGRKQEGGKNQSGGMDDKLFTSGQTVPLLVPPPNDYSGDGDVQDF